MPVPFFCLKISTAECTCWEWSNQVTFPVPELGVRGREASGYKQADTALTTLHHADSEEVDAHPWCLAVSISCFLLEPLKVGASLSLSQTCSTVAGLPGSNLQPNQAQSSSTLFTCEGHVHRIPCNKLMQM